MNISDDPDRMQSDILLDIRGARLSNAITGLNIYDENLIDKIEETARAQDIAIVCFRLRVFAAIIEKIGLRFRGGQRHKLRKIQERVAARGMDCIAVNSILPDSENPRYMFPLGDRDSHRFLVRNILLPRRYALGVVNRTMLRIYALAVSVGFLNDALVRFVTIIVSYKDD